MLPTAHEQQEIEHDLGRGKLGTAERSTSMSQLLKIKWITNINSGGLLSHGKPHSLPSTIVKIGVRLQQVVFHKDCRKRTSDWTTFSNHCRTLAFLWVITQSTEPTRRLPFVLCRYIPCLLRVPFEAAEIFNSTRGGTLKPKLFPTPVRSKELTSKMSCE